MLNQQPIVNGFDQIKVNNDDEILIYHIADNSLPWMVSQMTSGTDSVKTNQMVQILSTLQIWMSMWAMTSITSKTDWCTDCAIRQTN